MSSACACACIKIYVRAGAAQIIFVGALPQMKTEKMSGTSGKIISMKSRGMYVGMSWHEKGRKQEDAYTKTQNHS